MPAKKKVEKAEKGAANNSATKGDDTTSGSLADQLIKEGIIVTYALSSKKIHRNVRDINASNLTMTFNGIPLIEEAELTLNYGNRYGFIGVLSSNT